MAPHQQNHLNRISVYQADPSRIPEQWLDGFYRSLSIAERSKAHRFVNKKDRVSHVITYGLLRLILSHHCHLAPEEIQIHRSSLGKPYVAGNMPHFNLSHTKNLLVIAVAGDEVGVDVEYVNPAFLFQHVAEFVLCKAEQQTLACIPPHQQQAKFFEYWTAKEALLKLLGTGLRRDPTTLHMAHNEAGGIRSARFPTIRLVPLQIIDGDFVGHVAYGHQNPSIVYQAIPTLHVL
jgi:4'-phosphopantetheinyl transferase